MPAVEQPTNATVNREPYYGEQKAIEEQAASAPMPQERATPAPGPVNIPGGPPPGVSTVADNRGGINEVVPPQGQWPITPARPTTTAEQVGAALMSLGTRSPMTRRYAQALLGFDVPGVYAQVPPRDLVVGRNRERYGPVETTPEVQAEQQEALEANLAGEEA